MKEQKKKIGSVFKRAREKEQLSLEKAAKETRISQKYLIMLEEEDFSRIPGDVALKGFIRIYSDYLGIDSKPLIAELTKMMKTEATLPVEQEGTEEKEFDYERALWIAGAAVVVIAVIYLLALSGKFAYDQMNSISQKPATGPSSVVPRSVQASGEAGALDLKAVAVSKTWISVEMDGKPAYSGILKQGEERSFSAKSKIVMRIGNAAGIKVVSGDKVLLAPGVTGEVVTEEFTK